MNYTMVHELPGRMRLRCGRFAFSQSEGERIEAYLKKQDGVLDVTVCHHTGSLLLYYEGAGNGDLLRLIRAMDLNDLSEVGEYTTFMRKRDADFKRDLWRTVRRFLTNRYLMPLPLRHVFSILKSVKFILRGLDSLLIRQRVDVSVLDATAVGVSLIRRSYGTAGSIMFLLSLSEHLEDWTKKKYKDDLADSLAVNIDTVWVERDGTEALVPMSSLALGEHVVVRTGAMIPVDGVIAKGEAMINQASMTGEALPVLRKAGNMVYNGTLVEEGCIVIRADAMEKETRINKILNMIENSEHLKAELQSKTEKLADSFVKYSFLASGLIYFLTRNPVKALSVLLVDYSCAIKLSTPLAILSAMSEASKHRVLVKGGKFLEAYASADTIIFDKTGTLTIANPKVEKVIPFAGFSREEILKTAACLEEHFPHSVAQAVVRQAAAEGLFHQEEHSEVEYVVAHGISSRLHGRRVLIGSAHFIFDDEGIVPTEEQQSLIEEQVAANSVLYLAVGDQLAGMICISDPLREEAAAVIQALKDLGIKRVVMLTGDSPQAARSVAGTLGLDDYRAQVLPEDKAGYIRSLVEAGHTVIMVGDGVNDSPALAAANVGVAMKNGSDIAREVSDITLLGSRLDDLVFLRALSMKAMERIKGNYAFIMSFNSLLLGLGLVGVTTPGTGALLHNLSTLGVSLNSSRKLLGDGEYA